MSRRTVLLLLLLFSGLSLSAQVHFMHSFGASYLLGTTENLTVGLPGISYQPRVHLAFGPELSLSLSTTPTLGYSGFFVPAGSGAATFGFEAPADFQFHFGMGATPNSEQRFGLFAGGGVGTAWIAGTSPTGGDSGFFVGPHAQIGANFMANEMPLGIRATYLHNMLDEKHGVWGLGLLYNFGLRSVE